jgi:DNA-binding transcriptional ArsR family regulator
MRNRVVSHSHDAVFSALADPTRRAVLDLLRSGSLPAGRIAEAFPVSRPAISKHLRLLRHAHLVDEERNSRQRIYSLNAAPLRALEGWLHGYRAFWTASLTSLQTVVESRRTERTPARRGKRS